MLPLFYNLRKTFTHIFSFRGIVTQATGGLCTYVIVTSGFERFYFVSIQHENVRQYFFPAVVIGGIVPVFGLPLLYLFSKIKKSKEGLLLTWMLAQAAMLGWIISSLYKAFTGRVQPPHVLLIDTSHNWNFGFLQHGIFWGWPSSHTTVAFAMAFALITYYKKEKWVVFGALLYAFYIGIGVSTGIHWFSEFVAGAIIGALIGSIVGTSFKQKGE